MTTDELRGEIARITKEDKIFSINKLAMAAGISRAHLSNFVRGTRELGTDTRADVETALKRMGVTHGDVFSAKKHYTQCLTDLVHGFDLRVLLSGTRAEELGYIGVERFFVQPDYRALEKTEMGKEEFFTGGIDALPRKKPVLHILGSAGSGKTTAIRYQILQMSKQERGPLPILLPLNALNRYLPTPPAVFAVPSEVGTRGGITQPQIENLFEAICAWTKATFQHDFRTLFEETLASGRAFIMLDGFDEVHTANRDTAIILINQFIRNHIDTGSKNGNRILITQRGYPPFSPNLIFENSALFEMVEFNQEQIKQLVDKWISVFGDSITHDPALIGLSEIVNLDSFIEKLRNGVESQPSGPSLRIMDLLQQGLKQAPARERNGGAKVPLDGVELIKALNHIIKRRDFYRPADFTGIELSEETKTYLSRTPNDLSDKEVQRFNRLLLEDAYKDELRRSRIRRPLSNVSLFKEAMLRPPLDKLTANPFFLTLLTAIFLSRGIEEVFVQPAKAAVLNSYYRAILGIWNNVRSLDGFPTPARDRFPRGLSQFLLSNLAWEMIGRGGNIGKTSLSLYKTIETFAGSYAQYNYGAKPPLPNNPRSTNAAAFRGISNEEAPAFHDISREEATAFRDISKDAGIITSESPGEDCFLHKIVRDWFLSAYMRNRPGLLHKFLEPYLLEPSPDSVEWKDPLALTLSATGVVDENTEELWGKVQFSLESYPLGNERLNLVLPLGLDLCLQLVEDGGAYPGLERVILIQLRRFFETTEYAVLTDSLQPRIIKLLPRAEWWERDIPRDPIKLGKWLEDIAGLDDRGWATEVDKVWRYQTEISCFDLLLRAVDERLVKGEKHEKLYRRLTFGLRFAKGDPRQKVERLYYIAKRGDLNPVICSMALYSLKNIYYHLRKEGTEPSLLEKIKGILREVNGVEHQRMKIDEIDASTVKGFVEHLIPCHIEFLVEQANSKILEEFKTKSGLPEEKIIDDLVGILNCSETQRWQGDLHRARAIAIVLLVSIFENNLFGKSYENLYPGHLKHTHPRAGSDEEVFHALLNAVEVNDEKKQHENVDACQVYDFAAWGLRRIFIKSSDLSSLPLPPRGDSLDVGNIDI
jgi:transcriptional regulator with XRE-family HTH domain